MCMCARGESQLLFEFLLNSLGTLMEKNYIYIFFKGCIYYTLAARALGQAVQCATNFF